MCSCYLFLCFVTFCKISPVAFNCTALSMNSFRSFGLPTTYPSPHSHTMHCVGADRSTSTCISIRRYKQHACNRFSTSPLFLLSSITCQKTIFAATAATVQIRIYGYCTNQKLKTKEHKTIAIRCQNTNHAFDAVQLEKWNSEADTATNWIQIRNTAYSYWMHMVRLYAVINIHACTIRLRYTHTLQSFNGIRFVWQWSWKRLHQQQISWLKTVEETTSYQLLSRACFHFYH